MSLSLSRTPGGPGSACGAGTKTPSPQLATTCLAESVSGERSEAGGNGVPSTCSLSSFRPPPLQNPLNLSLDGPSAGRGFTAPETPTCWCTGCSRGRSPWLLRSQVRPLRFSPNPRAPSWLVLPPPRLNRVGTRTSHTRSSGSPRGWKQPFGCLVRLFLPPPQSKEGFRGGGASSLSCVCVCV